MLAAPKKHGEDDLQEYLWPGLIDVYQEAVPIWSPQIFCLPDLRVQHTVFEETDFGFKVKSISPERLWVKTHDGLLCKPTSVALFVPACALAAVQRGVGPGGSWAVILAASRGWAEVAGAVLCCWGTAISRSHSDFTALFSSVLRFWLALCNSLKAFPGVQWFVNMSAPSWT